MYRLKFFLYVAFGLLTSCSSVINIPDNKSIHLVNMNSSAYFVRSYYRPSGKNIYIKMLDDFNSTHVSSISFGERSISFYASNSLMSCFDSNNVDLIYDENYFYHGFTEFFPRIDFEVYIVPEVGFDVTIERKINSNEPIAIIMSMPLKYCDLPSIYETFVKAVRVIVHELFHVYIFGNKWVVDHYDEEFLAYTIDFCNEYLSSNVKNLDFTYNFNEKEFEMHYYNRNRGDRVSYSASLGFKKFAIDNLLDATKKFEDNKSEKNRYFLEKTCSPIFDFVSGYKDQGVRVVEVAELR
ncbi:hypothetical protein W04_0486 [Pseudoalteromonas sp. SW0106-04]|uniref:hypothetical protein n=1 Tax=Pseudoalteromonas sp. SW0106-04 TaxID=1702169 RepID=UPI0006B5CBA0|nr:hypothetical protein [Pseudoalteromonas sp. SW0106-04]GAP73975.1 hypothetical protein W04_0486 [Pseudoalteromonas sp. SW0106-04]